MKRLIFVFFIISLFTASTGFAFTTLTSGNNEAEKIINQCIHYIKYNQWDEYVELFNYDSEVKEHLLSFLKNSRNQSNKEGIHGINEIRLVSIELSNDPEFSSKGDYVYDVLLDMKVHKTSEFYMNGVTHHIFVFKMTSDGLKIETVYFNGLAGGYDNNQKR